MIVEDSEDDALLLLRELRKGGYAPDYERVDTAPALEAALEKGEWDIVVSDHSMPNFSSSAALELLQSKGLDLPFIIVSGTIGEDLAVMAMKAGAHDYLMKGNLARLNTAIERELRDAEVRRERKEAEAKYRSIFENAVEGIFQTTVEGRIVTANPALAHMYGYGSPEELLSDVSDVTHQLYVEPARRDEFDRLVRRHDAVSGFEMHTYRRDGGVIWTSVSARAVRDAAGNLLGYEGTVEDITERKRVETALREIREAERRRIARDLHDEAMQDLSFVLQSMQFTQMTSPEEDGNLEREIQALRRAIAGLRNAVYDLRLGGDVRDQTFLRSLESLVELNRQMAPERELELHVEDGFPKDFGGDAGVELLRILQEALVNVRRHSGASHARIVLGCEGDGILARVEDDGQGFEPGMGAGIGLTGMRERAQALGGELEVESEPGKGTKLRLRAPMPAPAEPDPES